MTPEERQLLSALAQRVKTVPPQQKDPEAEQFIRQLVMERPDTPYVLAQTVIMQDFALRNAQSQIEELQRQMSEMAPPAQERPGSFLGGLFGRSPSPQPSTSSSGSVPRVNPWSNPDMPPPGYGGAPGQGQGYGAPPGQGQLRCASRPRLWHSATGPRRSRRRQGPSFGARQARRLESREAPCFSRASTPCFQAITVFRTRPWRASTPKTA